jgi:hypothetical protein
MQIYVGVKVYIDPFVTLALNRVSSQLQASAAVPSLPPLPTEKVSGIQLNRRLRGLQSQSRSFGNGTNLFPHHESNHNPIDVQPLAKSMS